jgi:hypothetical protein
MDLGTGPLMRRCARSRLVSKTNWKAVGWLMEVGWPAETKKQRCVACVGDHRSEPLPLEEAKTAARSLLSTKGKAEPREELNQLVAHKVDRVEIERQRRTWPLDLMAGQRHRSHEAPPQDRSETTSGHPWIPSAY